MLVLSRKSGESVAVTSDTETWTVTVLKFDAERHTMSILVNRATATRPGHMEIRRADVRINETFKITDTDDVTLVDVRADEVRLGINAPRSKSVQRLEFYETTHRADDDDDPGEEFGGSPVPRPSSPTPPSLNVKLEEPRETDDGSE